MKRSASLAIAAVLALTAAVRIPASHPSPVRKEGEATQSAARSKHLSKSVSNAGYSAGCTAYDTADDKAPPDENRAAAKGVLDSFFASDAKQDTAQSLRNHPGVRYAIALTADPRHTNLSLMFDRQMAAVQQAAQDEDYTYNSSWLPWSVDQSSYPLLADQQAAEDVSSRREACPGMLLFRRSVSAEHDPYGQALVVLVVGEQPTGGINQDQWQNAIHWLMQNASEKGADQHAQALRVLGPSFSGSLVSLGRNLNQIYSVQPNEGGSFAARFPQALVLSGSVSDCASVRWFQQLRWPILPHASLPAVVFGTFQENDDREIYSFLNYLESQGTKANDTAILSEDETAYSDNPAVTADTADTSIQPCAFPYPAEHRPVRLFFPRDISALRNAYEKESIFATSVSGQGERTLHPILQEGGEAAGESGNPSDTIQAYSGRLTPIAQEAVLYGIVSYMRAHHTRFVMLRCTNPLDFLFLTRFFHRAYPEGRIVTIGSDLLFRREIDTTEFRGVLALSNYPLLPRNQHWSMLSEKPEPLPGHAHRVFETATVQGTYLAARYLFSSGQELSQPRVAGTSISLPLKESLPDYADPFWLHKPWEILRESRAPVWLMVVGRDGYWPIAVFSDSQNTLSPPSTMVRLTSDKAHYDLESDGKHFNETLRSKLPLAWTICVWLGFSLMLYQGCGILLGDGNASQGLFSVFRRVSAGSQDILLGINSAFAAMLLVTPLSIGLTLPRGDMFATADWEYVTFLLLGIAEILLVAIGLLRKRGWLAAGCFAGSLLAFTGVSLYVLEVTLVGPQIGEQANRVPLFYRMGHVTAGVAPLLPVLFLFTGFYLWTWHAMAGNTLLCNGRPILPRLERVPARHGLARWYWVLLGNPVQATGSGWHRLHRSQIRMSQELGKRIVALASPISVPLSVIALPFCLLAGSWVCFHGELPLVSLEGHAFALWLNLGLLLALLLIAAETARLFWTWIELRLLLAKLNRLRLRRTFAKLRVVEASSLWSVSGGVQRVQYLFFSQQLDAATRLASLVRTPFPALHDVVECGRNFDRRNARRLNSGARWDRLVQRPSDLAMVTIRDVFADAVAEVYNRVLSPWWSHEATSLTLTDTTSGAEDESPAPLELPLSEDATIRTAEEFVCFHYIAFIQNILARMRTMTLSMILLFVAVTLAISFYPFVPRTQISMWMIVNLALIGSVVVYVYAGMDRDEILSYITNTRPGRLSGAFWLKSAAFLAGPMIGILTTQFPAVSEPVLAWVQPALDSMSH